MKCSFCSNELESGAEFCPHCGMILSLGNDDTSAKETKTENEVQEKTENVFNPGSPIAEEDFHVAMELEPDTTEEYVPVVEGIPEYVSSLPEEEIEPPHARVRNGTECGRAGRWSIPCIQR